MNSRLSPTAFYERYPRIVTHLTELGNLSLDIEIDVKILNLVKLLASQINHCGFCQQLHAKEARDEGESQARLDVLTAWRDIGVFTDKERIAFEWTEALTLVSYKEIDDKLFEKAVKTFGEKVLIELTSVILQINSWNRLSISLRFQPEV